MKIQEFLIEETRFYKDPDLLYDSNTLLNEYTDNCERINLKLVLSLKELIHQKKYGFKDEIIKNIDGDTLFAMLFTTLVSNEKMLKEKLDKSKTSKTTENNKMNFNAQNPFDFQRNFISIHPYNPFSQDNNKELNEDTPVNNYNLNRIIYDPNLELNLTDSIPIKNKDMKTQIFKLELNKLKNICFSCNDSPTNSLNEMLVHIYNFKNNSGINIKQICLPKVYFLRSDERNKLLKNMRNLFETYINNYNAFETILLCNCKYYKFCAVSDGFLFEEIDSETANTIDHFIEKPVNSNIFYFKKALDDLSFSHIKFNYNTQNQSNPFSSNQCISK